MSTSSRGLWRHAAFRVLWAGQATSLFGSLIGGFAYSLVAILTLHAGPAQLAVLNGCAVIPPLLAGPWIGLWVDRLRHRPLLIGVDLLRAATIGSIPLAALLGGLTMLQLYAVAVLMAVLGALFDVTLRGYLPLLLPRESLLAGNSVFSGTAAVAEAGGFSLSGVLVGVVGAPFTLVCDAVSFLVSAGSLLFVPSVPRAAFHREPTRSQRDELLYGVRLLWSDPILRSLAVSSVVWGVAGNAIGVVIMLFFVRDLHLHPLQMGPLFGIGGLSAFLGALVASRVVRRWGPGPSLIGGMLVDTLGLLAIVVAGGPLPLIIVLMALAQSTDGGRAVYDIVVTTAFQSRAPAPAAGRVLAAYDTLVAAAGVGGLLIGGVMGSVVGLRGVLIGALIVEAALPAYLLLTPLRRFTTGGEST